MPTNQTATTVDSIIKDAIINIAEPIIETALVVDFPFLKLPIVNQIFNFLLGFLGSYFYKYTAETAVALVIDIQTKGEASAANQAITDLSAAITSGNVLDIKKSSDDFDAAMAALVHDDGEVKI